MNMSLTAVYFFKYDHEDGANKSTTSAQRCKQEV